MPLTEAEETRLTLLEQELRRLTDRLAQYEQNGLQGARFTNLNELYAAKSHTH